MLLETSWIYSKHISTLKIIASNDSRKEFKSEHLTHLVVNQQNNKKVFPQKLYGLKGHKKDLSFDPLLIPKTTIGPDSYGVFLIKKTAEIVGVK